MGWRTVLSDPSDDQLPPAVRKNRTSGQSPNRKGPVSEALGADRRPLHRPRGRALASGPGTVTDRLSRTPPWVPGAHDLWDADLCPQRWARGRLGQTGRYLSFYIMKKEVLDSPWGELRELSLGQGASGTASPSSRLGARDNPAATDRRERGPSLLTRSLDGCSDGHRGRGTRPARTPSDRHHPRPGAPGTPDPAGSTVRTVNGPRGAPGILAGRPGLGSGVVALRAVLGNAAGDGCPVVPGRRRRPAQR